MKAKNSEKIIRGYLEFAGGLLISTALSMALLTGFIHTNGSEYKLMESKTQEYDKIYARQIAAPLDAVRLGKTTPCAKLGYCIDCRHPERICNSFVAIEGQFIKDRIKIIIVDMNMGF